MLYVTGRLGGKDYKDDVVDPSIIAKAVGAPEKPEGDDVLVINSYRPLFGVNKDGQPKGPSSIWAFVRYPVEMGDNSFELRYADRKEGSGDKVTYTPASAMMFTGREQGFKANKYGLFVFMWLHPLTETSPIFNRGGEPKFEYIDVKMEAALKNAAMIRRSKMQAEIIGNKSDWNIVVRAKGLVVRGETPMLEQSNDIATMAVQAKGELIRLLNKYPDAFEEAWNDYTTFTVGVFRTAMDKNLITIRAQSAGVKKGWYFVKKDGTLGDIICPIGQTSNEFQELVTFSQNPGNEELVGKVQKLIDASLTFEVPKEVAAPKEPLENAAISHLLKVGLIAYSKVEDAVRLYKNQADNEGTLIPLKGADGPDWTSRLIALCRSDKTLNSKVINAYQPNA